MKYELTLLDKSELKNRQMRTGCVVSCPVRETKRNKGKREELKKGIKKIAGKRRGTNKVDENKELGF
jgi:hypothetical protein